MGLQSLAVGIGIVSQRMLVSDAQATELHYFHRPTNLQLLHENQRLALYFVYWQFTSWRRL